MKTRCIITTAGLALATLIHQPSTSFAQGTAFTYQGRLNAGASPASGIYDLRFTIYDLPSAGSVVAGPLTNSTVGVSNGLFAVTLDFGAGVFTGADRWLELGVVTNGGGAFSPLAPRQQFTAAPYAIQSGSASNLLGVLPASQLGAGTAAINISGSAATFTGSLGGNVTGPQAATVVSTVGGVTAANVASGANAANAATSANTANTIVRRDAGGSFSAGSLTLAGNLNLPTTTAGGGIIKANGVNLLHSFNGNLFAGANAGNLTMIGNQNTGLGNNTLLAIAAGGDNTAVGSFALSSTTSGSANTASGTYALGANTTGNHNTAHGAYALGSNTNGIRNTAIGAEALFANTSGSGNTANGMLALRFNTIGSDNTAIGSQSLFSNTSGSGNTASGVEALFNNNGDNNTADGYRALYSNTNGVGNTANGSGALFANTSGSYNTATGGGALAGNTTGSENTANGFNALFLNTSGEGNTANGYLALWANGSGSRNTAVGYAALHNSTTGSNNIAIGHRAGYLTTTGSGNIQIGSSGPPTENNVIRIGAGQTNTFIDGISGATVANGNVVVVNSAGQLGTSPAVGVWTSSGDNVYRTNGSVGIGTAAPAQPLHIAAGEPVIILQDTGHSAIGQVGYISYRNNAFTETAWVGYGTVTDPDFSIVNARSGGDIILSPLLGNVGISRTPTANKLEVEGTASKTAAGSWLANSDARIKTGVRTVSGALDKLAQVRLVEFHYTDAYRAQHPSLKDRSYLNVVAQEFQKVFPEDVQSSGEKLPGGDDAILQVDTYPLTIYSAAAIQELNRKLEAGSQTSEARVQKLEAENAELKHRLEKLERLMNQKNGGGK